MSEKTLEDKVDLLVSKVARIESALSYDGQGLIPAFQKHCESSDSFRQEYYSFKRKVLCVFFFLIGSGVLGFSTLEIVKAIR